MWLTMPNKTSILAALLLLLAITTLFIGAMIWLATTATQPVNLGYVEIREYEGIDLSSINAFKENSIRGPQHINKEDYSLTVTGLVNNELNCTYDDIISNYHLFEKVATLHCVEGWSVTILWEGVLVRDIIGAAGVDPNATVVIFYAYDGYSTSVPLDYIVDNNILMAYKMNGVVLPPERGFPFQLVAESKYGYKWIKWITDIELSDNEGYLGYWERRGYPNDADLR